MNTALLPKSFDALFGCDATPEAPDYFTQWCEDDAKRDLYVAERTPQLERIYRVTPDRVREAMDHAAMYLSERHTPLLLALLERNDHAEIGRLLLAAIDARIHNVAEDDAGDAAWGVVPERAR